MIKQVSDGAGYDRLDKMSDVDNKIYEMNEEIGDDGVLVGIKEGYNDLDSDINGNTKWLEEVKELAGVDLSIATTDSVKEKVT